MCAEQDHLLFAKLNQETALIHWDQLQRFFAQGKVFVVNSKQDLVGVAEQIASNDFSQVGKLIDSAKISQVSDKQARTWIKDNKQLWAVVIAPWVLVQEPSKKS